MNLKKLIYNAHHTIRILKCSNSIWILGYSNYIRQITEQLKYSNIRIFEYRKIRQIFPALVFIHLFVSNFSLLIMFLENIFLLYDEIKRHGSVSRQVYIYIYTLRVKIKGTL